MTAAPQSCQPSIVERLRSRSAAHHKASLGSSMGLGYYSGYDAQTMSEAADHIERLEERSEAYKGQVKAGSDEIAGLKTRVEELESDCLRLHKDAVDRWEFLKETEIISDKCVNAEVYGASNALEDLQAIRRIIKRAALPKQEPGT